MEKVYDIFQYFLTFYGDKKNLHSSPNITHDLTQYGSDIRYNNPIFGEVNYSGNLPFIILTKILRSYIDAMAEDRYEIIQFIWKFKSISKGFTENIVKHARFKKFFIFSIEDLNLCLNISKCTKGFELIHVKYTTPFTLPQNKSRIVECLNGININSPKYDIVLLSLDYGLSQSIIDFLDNLSNCEIYSFDLQPQRKFFDNMNKEYICNTLKILLNTRQLKFSAKNEPPNHRVRGFGFMGGFKNLTSFDCKFNYPPLPDVLVDVLRDNQTLEAFKLDISDCPIAFFSNGLFTELLNHPTLKTLHLNIYGNQLPSHTLLSQFIVENKNITDLSFQVFSNNLSNLLNNDGIYINLYPLKKLSVVNIYPDFYKSWDPIETSVKYLTLHSVNQLPSNIHSYFYLIQQLVLDQLDPFGNVNILNGLIEASPNLNYLKIAFKSASYESCSICAAHIMQSIPYSKSIECLILKNCNVGSHSLTQFFSAHCPALKVFELMNVNGTIRDDCLKALIENRNLQSISLHHLILNFKNLYEIIIDLLKKNHSIKDLDLPNSMLIGNEEYEGDKKLSTLINLLKEKEYQIRSIRFSVGCKLYTERLKRFFLESTINFYSYSREQYEIEK